MKSKDSLLSSSIGLNKVLRMVTSILYNSLWLQYGILDKLVTCICVTQRSTPTLYLGDIVYEWFLMINLFFGKFMSNLSFISCVCLILQKYFTHTCKEQSGMLCHSLGGAVIFISWQDYGSCLGCFRSVV